MSIDMPHSPSELAESFAKRDIEIDIRDMTDDEAEILGTFLIDHGFSSLFHNEGVIELILDWRDRYGILVSDGDRDIGANDPDRRFATARFTIGEVMEILPRPMQTISIEDFESVF